MPMAVAKIRHATPIEASRRAPMNLTPSAVAGQTLFPAIILAITILCLGIVVPTRKVVLGVTTGVATVKQATVMRQLSYNPATSNAWRIVDAEDC